MLIQSLSSANINWHTCHPKLNTCDLLEKKKKPPSQLLTSLDIFFTAIF